MLVDLVKFVYIKLGPIYMLQLSTLLYATCRHCNTGTTVGHDIKNVVRF